MGIRAVVLSTRTLGLPHSVKVDFPAAMNVCADSRFDLSTVPPDTGETVLRG